METLRYEGAEEPGTPSFPPPTDFFPWLLYTLLLNHAAAIIIT